jgi:hypothetical protein
MTLRVVAAAVLDERGEVHSLPAPARHCDVIRAMSEKGLRAMGPDIEQGFLLSDGRFCRRKPAKRIARAAGQLLPRASKLEELFSEDVW